MTDYDAKTGAKAILRLTRGLNAFCIGDTFIHPTIGKMTVSKVHGFQEGMTFGKQLKVVGLWVVMAVRDGKKRPEKIMFQVPDLTKPSINGAGKVP